MIDRRNLVTVVALGLGGLAGPARGQQPAPRVQPAPRAAPHQVTFTVDGVTPGTARLPTVPVKAAIEALLGDPHLQLESWSRQTPALLRYDARLAGLHPFLLAINTAYDQHYPIVMSPDMIWLLILQGLATHVSAHAESLRKSFVAHDGKLVVRVRRDGFVKGNPDNDWQGVFAEFSSQLRTHIGADAHGLIVNAFSTTGPVEQAAMEVCLMDTLQAYFVYVTETACGFPSITLEGTTDDWLQLRGRAAALQGYALDWWIPHLLPVLDQFVLASQGKPDKAFWCDFFKVRDGSGGTWIQGHVLNLFPYFGKKRPTDARLLADYEAWLSLQFRGRMAADDMKRMLAEFKGTLTSGAFQAAPLRRNPYLGQSPKGAFEGMTTADVTAKMSSTPMIWQYHDTALQMELLAGFMGATQDPATLAIRPTIGWVVRQGVG